MNQQFTAGEVMPPSNPNKHERSVEFVLMGLIFLIVGADFIWDGLQGHDHYWSKCKWVYDSKEVLAQGIILFIIGSLCLFWRSAKR